MNVGRVDTRAHTHTVRRRVSLFSAYKLLDGDIKPVGVPDRVAIFRLQRSQYRSRSVVTAHRGTAGESLGVEQERTTNVSASRGKIVTRLSNYGTLHHERLSTAPGGTRVLL